MSDSDEDPVEKASRKKKNRLNKLNDERLELALFSHQTPKKLKKEVKMKK